MSRTFSWFVLATIFLSILIGIVFYPDYRQAEKIQRNMMAMTTAAFQEAIIFAHMKYHTQSVGRGAHLDLVTIDGKGLDFNANGYPIGVDHSESSLTLPITVQNCRQLWQTLLVALRPALAPSAGAVLNTSALNGKCVFTSIKHFEQSIVYDPNTGRVSLVVYNSTNT